jgi:hypothetical protein
MPDRSDRDQHPLRRLEDTDVAHFAIRSDPEQARLGFASARAHNHAVRELYFLELAVRAPDDDSARQLESYAHEAYCDAHAITKEHDLDR